MTLKGWRVVKPQHNQSINGQLSVSIMWLGGISCQSVWGMIFQWVSTLKVSIELLAIFRHHRDMTERLLKAALSPNQTNKLLSKYFYVPLSKYLKKKSQGIAFPTIACAQQRLGSACTSTHSGQILYCLSKESMDVWLPIGHDAMTLNSLIWVSAWRTCDRVGNAVSRLICFLWYFLH